MSDSAQPKPISDKDVASTTLMTQNTLDQILVDEIASLKTRITAAEVPDALKAKVESMIERLERSIRLGSYTEEYERVTHYIDWVSSLPWKKKSEDILDLNHTREVLEKHHYGLQDVKERILEYVSVLKLKSQKANGGPVKAPILLLVGLVGTGKTTFAYSLAESLGRTIVRIPFGGMGSARDLRGQSRLHLEAEPGLVIKAMRQAGVKNPVILLDEIDRVGEESRNDIMGVLVELLDPGQNYAFTDHYVDYPVDLSEVIFIATANNTQHIATAVFDRLEQITMPSYTDQEKIEIARSYLMPQAIEEAGLTKENLVIDEAVWPNVVRPLGFDSGIRTLQRTIKNMCGKVAKEIVEKGVTQVHVNAENVKLYLPQY
jgi:ATP-dependent Lon protease